MVLWLPTDATHTRLDGLVAKGLLCPLTDAVEWIVPLSARVLAPTDGYVISFAHFHERGFATPSHKFFHGCSTTT
jgi:hypothetical protein